VALDGLLIRLRNYPTLGDLKEISEDNNGRFRVWIGNLGALQPPKSTKSLDYRLRNATYIRAGVVTGLERLENLATRGEQQETNLASLPHSLVEQLWGTAIVLRDRVDEKLQCPQLSAPFQIWKRMMEAHTQQLVVQHQTLFGSH
jgi:hypothetical protein